MTDPAPTGFTVVETAQVVGTLQWAAEQLSVRFGEWAETSDDPAFVAWAAETCRHLGEHAAALADIMPDSVLLEGAREVGPDGSRLEALIVDGLPADAAAMLGELVTRCDAVVARCSVHADGALARVGAALRHEVVANLTRCVAVE